jgi:hypothetical protein
MTSEAFIAGAYLGEHQAAEEFIFTVEGKSGVKRELYVVGAGEFPGFVGNVACLVVNYQKRVVVEPVYSVESEVEGEPAYGYGAAGFSFCHLKSNTGSFELEPLDNMPGEALLF